MSEILGVKISEESLSQILKKIREFLQSNSLHQIATVNPEFILEARKDTQFKKVLDETDLNLPDGFGLQCAAWFLGKKISERITGVDLTWEIAKIAAENHYSIFLLGAKEGIAEKTAEKLKLIYPELKIAGTYAGSPEEEGIIEKINNSKTDILLVAFGAPKQDKFIYNLKTAFSDFGFRASDLPKVAMGVGGTFDYISGNISRAPKWMRKVGLEWLYRLFHQPKRIGRIFNATIKFPILIIGSRFKKQKGRSA